MKYIPGNGLQRGNSVSKADSVEEELCISWRYGLGYLSALSGKLQWEYSSTSTYAF